MLSINPFQLKQTQTKIHLLKNWWSFNWATDIVVNETTPSFLNSSRHTLMVLFLSLSLSLFFFVAKWLFSICESILWVNLVKSIQTSCSFFSLIPFPLVEDTQEFIYQRQTQQRDPPIWISKELKGVDLSWNLINWE